MEITRLYLDADILILLGEGKDERASLLTELAVGQETSSTPFLCTGELTLAELLVKPYREQDDRLIQPYENWMTPGGFMEIGPVHSSQFCVAICSRSSLTVRVHQAPRRDSPVDGNRLRLQSFPQWRYAYSRSDRALSYALGADSRAFHLGCASARPGRTSHHHPERAPT